MSTKHDLLTEKEFESFDLNSDLKKLIEKFESEHPELNSADIKILDWGCGRGRAVLKLLRKGYSAYGTDIDHEVLRKGDSIFKKSGYDPGKHLLSVDDLRKTEDNFFHIIFSEQVFEHIEDINSVIKNQFRLLKPGGYGFHLFPSSKTVRESHVNMPFIHWFPKNKIRKLFIVLMILLNKKPEIPWPEVEKASLLNEAEFYYRYLEEKTFYRDNRDIKKLFESQGFKANYNIMGYHSPKRKIIPDFLKRNGFPDQQVRFYVIKKYQY